MITNTICWKLARRMSEIWVSERPSCGARLILWSYNVDMWRTLEKKTKKKKKTNSPFVFFFFHPQSDCLFALTSAAITRRLVSRCNLHARRLRDLGEGGWWMRVQIVNHYVSSPVARAERQLAEDTNDQVGLSN